MNKTNAGVLRHFDNMANIFDSIYEGEQKPFLYKSVDMLFRKSILERRLRLILSLTGEVGGKDILDIGCGSGRYAVLLAKGGPNAVLGLDVSSRMIELARRSAQAGKVSDICRFERHDFMQREFNGKFDIIIASGLFDYTADPRPFLLKIKNLLRGKALLSFPLKWTVLTPVRMLWLRKRKCPSYYYTKGGILRLAKDCGLKVDLIERIGSFLVPGNYIVALTLPMDKSRGFSGKPAIAGLAPDGSARTEEC